MAIKNEDNLDLLPILTIPKSANYSLPDDTLLAFYENLEDRVFYLTDEINQYSLNLIHYIRKWNKEDKDIPVEERKPIKLLIHSPGGDLDVLGVISDMILLSETPIYGYNLGNAYSAAGMILLSCHKRYGLKNSTVLFHQGSCTNINGSYEEVQAFMEEYRKMVDKLSKVILERTNFSKEFIDEKMKGDWYLTSEECVKNGVYDGIVKSIYELV